MLRRQFLHSKVVESRFVHPTDAVSAGEIEAAGGHERHVETRQQRAAAEAAFIIDQALVYNHGATEWQRLIGLRQQHLLGLKIPIVKHAAENHDIGARQRLPQEITTLEAQSI